MTPDEFIDSLNLSDERKEYARYAYNQAANHPLAQKFDNYPVTKVKQLYQESRFDPNAVSPVGATGVSQFMPNTMPEVGLDAESARDPYRSIDASFLYDEILGRQLRNKGMEDNLTNTLAAYNAGAGNVSKYGGVPPFSETQKYLNIILGDGSNVSDYVRAEASQQRSETANRDVLETFHEMSDPYGEREILQPFDIGNPMDVDRVINRSRDWVMNPNTAIASTGDYDDLVQAGLIYQGEDGTYDAPTNPYTAYSRSLNRYGSDGAKRIAAEFNDDTDSAFMYGIDVFQKTFGEGIAALGDWAGIESLSGFGQRIVQQQENDIAEGGFQRQYEGSFSEQQISDKLGWLWENMMIQAPNIAANVALTVIPFGAGAQLGRFGVMGLNKGFQAAGKTAVSSAMNNRVKTVLGGVSASLAGGIQGTGSMVEELKEKRVYDEDALSTAVGFGVISGALNSALPAFAFGQIGGSQLSKAASSALSGKLGVMKNVPESLLMEVGKDTLKGAAIEGGTEVIEEALQMTFAEWEGAEYADGEFGARIIDALVLGGSMGAGLSASASAPKYMIAKNALNKIEKQYADISSEDVETRVEDEVSQPQEDVVETQESEQLDVTSESITSKRMSREEKAELHKKAEQAESVIKPEYEDQFNKFTNGEVRETYNRRGLSGNDKAVSSDNIVSFAKLTGQIAKSMNTANKKVVASGYKVKDYGKFKNRQFKNATTRIDEIFNSLGGVDVKVGELGYNSLGDKKADLYGNGVIAVGEDKFTKSLLYKKSKDSNLTYGEKLDAIYNVYGNAVGNQASTIEGTINSIQRVASMFPENSRAAVTSELLARKLSHLSTDGSVEAMGNMQYFGSNLDKAIADNDTASIKELLGLIKEAQGNISYFDESSYKSDLFPSSVVNNMVSIISDAETANADSEFFLQERLTEVIKPYKIRPEDLYTDYGAVQADKVAKAQTLAGGQQNLGIHSWTEDTAIDTLIKESKKNDTRYNADRIETLSKMGTDATDKVGTANFDILEGGIMERAANKLTERFKDSSPPVKKAVNYITSAVLNVKDSSLERLENVGRGGLSAQGFKALQLSELTRKYVKDKTTQLKQQKEYQDASPEEKKLMEANVGQRVGFYLNKILDGGYIPMQKDPSKGFSVTNIAEAGKNKDGSSLYYYIDLENNTQFVADKVLAQIGSEASRFRAELQDKVIESAIGDANRINDILNESTRKLDEATNSLIMESGGSVESWLAKGQQRTLKAYTDTGGTTLFDKFTENSDFYPTIKEAFTSAINEHYPREGSYVSKILLDNIDIVAQERVKFDRGDSGIAMSSKLEEEKNSIMREIMDAVQIASSSDQDVVRYETYKKAIEGITNNPIGVEHDLLIGAYTGNLREGLAKEMTAYDNVTKNLNAQLDHIERLRQSHNGLGAYVTRMYRAHSDAPFARKMVKAKKIVSDEEYSKLRDKYSGTNDFVKTDAFVYRYNKAYRDKVDYLFLSRDRIKESLENLEVRKEDTSSFGVTVAQAKADFKESMKESDKGNITLREAIQKTKSADLINHEVSVMAQGMIDSMVDDSNSQYDNGFGGLGYSEQIFLKRNEMTASDRELLGEYTDFESRVKQTLVSIAKYNAVKSVQDFVYDNYVNVPLADKFVFSESEVTRAVNNPDKELSSRASNLVEVDFKFLEKFKEIKQDAGQEVGDKKKTEKFYTTPEVKNALSSYDNLVSDNAFMQVYQGFNSEFKYWTTIANPEQYAANLMSNIPSLIMNGNYTNFINPDSVSTNGQPSTWVTDLARLIRSGEGTVTVEDPDSDTVNSEFSDELNEALKNIDATSDDIRLFKSALAKKPLRFAFDFVVNSASDTKAGTVTNKASNVVDSVTRFFEDFYSLGDLAPKLSAYMYNKRMLSDKFGSKGGGTLTEQQITQLATDITTLTMPNFSQLPKVLRDIQTKTPIGGSFVSFQFFAFSTLVNQFKVIRRLQEVGAIDYMARKDPSFDVEAEMKRQKESRGIFSASRPTEAMSEYMRSDEYNGSPAQIKMGGLIGGVGMYSGIMTTISTAVVSALGGEEVEELNSDEMKQQVRNMLPEYYKNLDFTITGMNDDGTIRILNTSRLNNFAPVKDIYTVSTNESLSYWDKSKGIMDIMSFDLQQQNFGYKFINETLFNGVDEFGKRLYEEDDSIMEMVAKATGRYFDTIATNSFIKDIKNLGASTDIAASMFGDEIKYDKNGYEISGKDVVLGLSGFRMITVDPVRDSSYKIREIKGSLRNSRTDLSSRLTSNLSRYNKVSDADITSSLIRGRDWHYKKHDELLTVIQTMKDFGIDDSTIFDTLNSSGVSKKDAKILMGGGYPSFNIDDIGKSKEEAASSYSISQEAKANMSYNFERMRMLNNNLPMHESQKSSSLFDIYFPQR